MKNSYYLRYYNPRLSGYVYRSRRPCGKSNCKCSQGRNNWHPYYYLTYTERVKGKSVNRWEYVPKPKVKALRQRIRRAKAKDKQRKQQYLHVISEMSRIISKLDNNAFDDGVWQSLNQLRTEIPSPAKLIVTFQQQITMMKCFAAVSELCIRRAGKN